MAQPVPVSKDEEHECPVPSAWRPTLRQIADALADKNYALLGIPNVDELDGDTAEAIAKIVEAYGETLSSLPEESWNTSVCQWQLSYWEVIVDLFTVESGRSDLILDVRVFEEDDAFGFKVHLVYVP